MSASILIGIDQGTTNSKAVAVDERGCVLAEAARPIATQAPRPGWVEQDAMAMYDNLVACVREVLAGAGRGAGEVAGLGIANQTETLVVWDRRTAMPVMPAMVWQCRRGEAEIASLRTAANQALVRERTGLDFDPTFTACKLKWLAVNRPEIAAALRRGDRLFGTVDCWLIWKLTGGRVYATEAGNASRTMLVDIARLAWDRELLELFGLEIAELPEIRRSSGPFGTTSEDLFGAPIPITGALGDQQASLFGHGCFEAGQIKATYGTGAFIWVNAGSRPEVAVGDGLIRTVAWQLAQPCYALEGFVMSCGAMLEWLAARFGIAGGGRGVAMRAEAARGSGGAIIVPAFQGLAAPWWRPDVRAAILGLSEATSVDGICHAGLEAICFQLRAVMESIAHLGARGPDMLRVDGGPTRSSYLMQLQADILQRPLAVSAFDSVTAYGAALIAGIGAGVWRNLDQLQAVMRTPAVVQPDATDARRWDDAYERWHAAVATVLAMQGRA